MNVLIDRTRWVRLAGSFSRKFAAGGVPLATMRCLGFGDEFPPR